MDYFKYISYSNNISPIQFQYRKSVPFQAINAGGEDNFVSNPLTKNATKREIINIVQNNPQIIKRLQEYKIPLNVNMSELEKLKKGHLLETRILAANIYSNLPENLKNEVNLKDLQEAAMLHDYGKILIPDKILNKQNKLLPKEKEIIELHSELGYEILKDMGINQNVLRMIKYHHKLPNNQGYPKTADDFEYSIANQILTAADKYSALRETRSYKNSLTKEEALKILSNDVEEGIISKEIYDSLAKIGT